MTDKDMLNKLLEKLAEFCKDESYKIIEFSDLVCDEFNLTDSNLIKLINSMQDRGLISIRYIDEDEKEVCVAISSQGKVVIEDIKLKREQEIERIRQEEERERKRLEEERKRKEEDERIKKEEEERKIREEEERIRREEEERKRKEEEEFQRLLAIEMENERLENERLEREALALINDAKNLENIYDNNIIEQEYDKLDIIESNTTNEIFEYVKDENIKQDAIIARNKIKKFSKINAKKSNDVNTAISTQTDTPEILNANQMVVLNKNELKRFTRKTAFSWGFFGTLLGGGLLALISFLLEKLF